MKQSVSDWLLSSKPGSQSQPAKPPATFSTGTMCSAEKIASEEGKLLILTQLYLELQLGVEQAVRAAAADLMMGPTTQNHHRWVEQRP
jgi:hypothetical protein